MIQCVRCRYHLDEDTASERCPECGLPTRWSNRPTSLVEYPPKWVKRMAIGSATAVALVLLFIIFMGLTVSGTLEGVQGIWLPTPFVLLIAVSAFMISGHSRHWAEPRQRIVRSALRAVALLTTISYGLTIWMFEKHNYQFIDRCTLPFVIGMMLFPTLLFSRLRVLTRVIGDPALKEYCAIVAWGCGAIAVLLGGSILVEWAGWLEQMGSKHLEKIGFYFASAVTVAIGLFALWAMVVLVWCTRSLIQAVKISRDVASEWKAMQ